MKDSEPDPFATLLDDLKPLSGEFLAVLGEGADQRAGLRAAQQLLQGLMHGFVSRVLDDPRQPRFQPGYGPLMSFGAPSTDTVYTFASVDSAGTYRLSGTRGTSLFMNLSMGAFWQMGGKLTKRPGNRSFDTLSIGSDGRFEVIVGLKRPAGWAGDWWELPPGVEALGIRQIFNDWAGERDGVVTIERLDMPSLVPPRDAGELRRGIAELAAWTRGEILFWLRHAGQIRARGTPNALLVHDYSGGGGLPGQCYYEGEFAMDEGEALIVEVPVPARCKYWSIALCDPAFGGIDWVNRQSSLNGAQAALDADGVFRAVIALEDPGVPNWLDPAGNPRGFIQGRWLDADSAPLPTIRGVPFADLGRHLPAETPAVGGSERDQALRARRLAAQQRRLC